jgi:hypothetical protein
MKLYEVTSPGDDLYLLLKNRVASADSTNSPDFISWKTLHSMMGNLGGPNPELDATKLHGMLEIDPELEQRIMSIVAHYDGNGVELKTKNKTPKQAGPGQGEKHIAQMAKAATARRQG